MNITQRSFRAATQYPKYLPALMFGAAGIAVIGFVRLQLTTQSHTMDHIFAQYNTPESEESRRKSFEGHPDPRTNILNFLSWK